MTTTRADARPADNHAYRLVSQPSTWDAARRACAMWGAHLVTVTGADELGFLTRLVNGSAWIGASDQRMEGQFRWITGEPFVFHSFAQGEPDDVNATNNCAVLDRDRFWHDRLCSLRYPYVCEMD